MSFFFNFFLFSIKLKVPTTLTGKKEIEKENTSYIGRHFTPNNKYPQAKRNLLWEFDFFVNSPFKDLYMNYYAGPWDYVENL